MNNPVKLSVGVLFGLMCGAMIGTIIGSAYLTLALRSGVAGFDMFSVWKTSETLRAMPPEAFKVALGSVALFALGQGLLAFVWSWRKQRDDYGSAHWQTKPELKKNDMLHSVGNGFACGELGAPKSGAGYVSSKEIPHVMMVAPTRAGKGVRRCHGAAAGDGFDRDVEVEGLG
jgi:type IV secretion system protein VirD4